MGRFARYVQVVSWLLVAGYVEFVAHATGCVPYLHDNTGQNLQPSTRRYLRCQLFVFLRVRVEKCWVKQKDPCIEMRLVRCPHRFKQHGGVVVMSIAFPRSLMVQTLGMRPMYTCTPTPPPKHTHPSSPPSSARPPLDPLDPPRNPTRHPPTIKIARLCNHLLPIHKAFEGRVWVECNMPRNRGK